METAEVAIMGAGPYGLSIAGHLREIGIDARVFGEPMAYWRRHMPKGMLLRSSWDASSIGDPKRQFTLDAYQEQVGERLSRPIPLDAFVGYGLWFQRHVVPDLETRRAKSIESLDGTFSIAFEDGLQLRAERVIVATGLEPFAAIPKEFQALPSPLVTHASEYGNLDHLKDRTVAVVGGGQSAFETAALAHEAGASVEVLVRKPRVFWLQRSLKLHQRKGMIRNLLYPPTDVGPPVLNQIVSRPYVFRRFPEALQDRIAYRSIRPAGAGWLVPRLRSVRITTGRRITSCERSGRGVIVTLDDGSRRMVDHVILGTGFTIDAAAYSFLHGDILRKLAVHRGYPLLGQGFESSVPGLHFAGASSALSFGPVMRFVSGTTFTGAEILRALRAPGTQAVQAHRLHSLADSC